MTIQGNRLSVAGTASRLAIIVSLLFGCTGKSGAEGPAEAKAAPGGDGMHVLFIGNSLTYSNDLPLLVQAIAKAAGQNLQVDSVTSGGASLDDHWNDGAAQKAIASRRWSYVVMQHGPSSLPESRAELRAAVKRFAPVIRKAGAKPALFMVWPPADRISYFDDVRDAYALAASDVGGLFIPAGEAWRAAWRRDPKAPLYSLDDFHPSTAGSYAAALSIYGMLYKRPPQGLPARLTLDGGRVVEVPEALAKLLQDAATEANQKYGKP
jgi:lysophospholipase L1-like esterase